jgi:hypothetical protein
VSFGPYALAGRSNTTFYYSWPARAQIVHHHPCPFLGDLSKKIDCHGLFTPQGDVFMMINDTRVCCRVYNGTGLLYPDFVSRLDFNSTVEFNGTFIQGLADYYTYSHWYIFVDHTTQKPLKMGGFFTSLPESPESWLEFSAIREESHDTSLFDKPAFCDNAPVCEGPTFFAH